MAEKYTFKKRFHGPGVDDYNVILLDRGGTREKIVDRTKEQYTSWLAEGNTPEEEAYVAPAPQVDNRTQKKKDQDAFWPAHNREEVLDAIMEKLATGTSAAFDALVTERGF
jgi:hypothetical protein